MHLHAYLLIHAHIIFTYTIGIAICPNSEEVLIYSNANESDFSKWKLEHTLTGHDLVVSGLVAVSISVYLCGCILYIYTSYSVSNI